jgi:hypothetical protein
MTWFKVDDGLHSHRKAVRAGISAMGLWVMAGSWCANHLTDGFVPDYMAARLDPDFEAHAARLVDAGLWVVAEKNGEKGWQFHQWGEEGRQPTAESVLTKRQEAKGRMQRLREARRTPESGMPTDAPIPSAGVRANTERTSAEVSVPRPDPTRPDVVPTELPASDDADLPAGPSPNSNGRHLQAVADNDRLTPSAAPKRNWTGAQIDADPHFAAFWAAYPRKTDKGHARKAWLKVLRDGVDPDRVTAAAVAFRDDPDRTAKFTPYPATWLNGERWDDEPAEEPPAPGPRPFWEN